MDQFMTGKPPSNLDGKTAFVTGGLGLIGREIVRAMADAGASTVILDIDDSRGATYADDLANQGHNVHFEHFDIANLELVEEKIDLIWRKYGSLDIWVNSAYPHTGDWGAPAEELTLESWRANVDMHMTGYCWVSWKVCLAMKEKGGSLVNLGSTYGVQANDYSIYEGTGLTSPITYTAIKGGIINFTRALASYFGPFQVRVNNVCPGGIYDKQNETFVRNYSRRTPMRRMGKPKEIADAVVFVASDGASYISGATLMVDGGWSIV